MPKAKKNIKSLDDLSRMVEAAFGLAVELDQKMAAYLLSIVRMEIAEKIERKDAERQGWHAPPDQRQ